MSASGFLGFDFRYSPQFTRGVAAALHAQAQKADGADARAQRGVPPTLVATDRTGDKPDQPGATGMVGTTSRWGTPVSASASSKIGIRRRRSGANWRMLRSERASAGDDGVSRGCMTLSGCSTPIECDATGRKSPQQDRSHKPRHEANGARNAGNPHVACDVEWGWKRGMVGTPRPRPARQSSTLLTSGDWKRSHGANQ